MEFSEGFSSPCFVLLEGLETLFPCQGQRWGLMLGVPCVGQEAGGAGAAGEEEAGGGPDG